MEACCLSYEKVHCHAIPGVPSVKDPKLGMVKCSIGHEREAVRGMGSLIDLESSALSSSTRFYHQKSSKVFQDGTLVSLRGLLGRAP